ncbi:type VI secretion system protein [Gallaecimonas kandeliae]|uniref:type VI secretion system protein n=1 Tax=Gallaecimonas kandeliae TaxID=3029055 RepID=UPI00264757A2|nr:type VI secretion system protein [Gallaecimonas kandeliae]WKE64475.1 type VI secretion system protein [Gallaecimonas kandeliae]
MLVKGTLGIVLLLVLILVVLGLAIWWLRRRADLGWRRFGGAVRHVEEEVGLGDRYLMPWLLVVGEQDRDNEALCRAWKLSSGGDRSWFGRWWYSGDGAALVVPAAVFNHGEGALAQLSNWRRLLRSLARARPNRPLDAIVWVVSAKCLLGNEEAGAAGLRAYKKLTDLQQRLGLTLPVYLVVGEAEQVPGLDELVKVVPKEGRDLMLGWSSTMAPGAGYSPAWVDLAVDHLVTSLQEGIAELGALEDQLDENLVLLPRHLGELRGPLQSLLDPVFHGNALGEAPALRGLYLVAAQAPKAEAEPGFSALDEAPAPLELAFAGRLLRKRILAEQGLATPIPRILALRTRWHRAVLTGTALVGICWLGGMLWTWHSGVPKARLLAGGIERLSAARAEYQGATGSEDAAREATGAVAAALHSVPDWHLASGWLPSSLWSSDDGQIEVVLGYGFRDLLFKPFSDGLRYRIQTLQSMGQGSAAVGGASPQSPESWPDMVSATQLVDAAAQHEQRAREFNKLLEEGGGNLDVAGDLAHHLFKVELMPSKLNDRSLVEKVLQRTAGRPGQGLDLAQFQPQVASRFVTLLHHWLDTLYANNNLVINAEAVEKGLQALQAGSQVDRASLAQLAEQIDLLRRLVTSANAAWSGAKGRDLAPGFAATMDRASHLALLGEQPVSKVLAHADAVKQSFADRWLSRKGTLPAVLQSSPSGGIELQGDVGKLDTALLTLLGQSFSRQGKALGTEAIEAAFKQMDADTAGAALASFQSYQKYSDKDLPSAPERYRAGLLSAAEASTAQAMLQALVGSKGEGINLQAFPRSLHDEALRLGTLIKEAANLAAAFDELGQRQLAAATTQEVTKAALNLLQRADGTLAELGLYEPREGSFDWWNGKTGAALTAFESGSPQDLQAYLAAQQGAVTDLAGVVQGAVAWLADKEGSLTQADWQRVKQWQQLSSELEKYKAKSATSSLVALERLVNHDLDPMDMANCQASLAQIVAPGGGDFFAQKAGALLQMMASRCRVLRAQASVAAYDRLAQAFNQNLAGRFPFAANPAAPGVSPQAAAAFLQVLDSDMAMARFGLPQGQGQSQQAQAFLDGLATAEAWLKPLLTRDTTGAWEGVDVAVDWRTDRDREVGADQVIEWRLASDRQVLQHPATAQGMLRWRPGQPLSLALRWAKDAPQGPLEDPGQPSLSIEGAMAVWERKDNWSLLRLIRAHQVPAGKPQQGIPLELKVPVSNAKGNASQAQLFLRLACFVAGGKERLPPPVFPTQAPVLPAIAEAAPEPDQTEAP